MSDTNEPPRPDGPADEPAPPPPPFSESPPPPPPSSAPPPPPPPAGDNPYGAPADGSGGYGAPPPADGSGYEPPRMADPYAPGAQAPYSPVDALGYGWKKFVAAPGNLLLPMLVAWVGVLVIGAIVDFVILRPTLNSGAGLFLTEL